MLWRVKIILAVVGQPVTLNLDYLVMGFLPASTITGQTQLILRGDGGVIAVVPNANVTTVDYPQVLSTTSVTI